MKVLAFAAIVAATTLGAAGAQATQFIQNGGFEQSTYDHNTQFGASFGGQGVTGWTGLGNDNTAQHLEFYYRGGTQTTENATNQYGDSLGYLWGSFDTLSSQGGNFVGLDAGAPYQGVIEQSVSGLTAGQSYTLSFEWAGGQLRNRDGDTYDMIQVDFGGDTVFTPQVAVASHGFTGWMTQSYTFTAANATQTLRFLAIGGPGGLPPIAAIDNVSLTGGVPEPAAWALMLVGFGGLGAALRHRRRRLVAA